MRVRCRRRRRVLRRVKCCVGQLARESDRARRPRSHNYRLIFKIGSEARRVTRSPPDDIPLFLRRGGLAPAPAARPPRPAHATHDMMLII
ncbi:hypothetical protein RR48_09904 [Papilio machaon]|uniref:Uncharacterized protein n=1 Tax=Papilio machaon TaxID=76193 RepID=A0A194RDE0_PAPMA|nr:hypothetical protein RR48_09904 [Papilio machaon]